MNKGEAFREAMGRFAGAVNAITTDEDGQPKGMLATAVCSLSFDPPSVLVCVNKNASSHDAIVRRGAFAVSLLSPALAEVAGRFQTEKGPARFREGLWTPGPTGSPMLIGAPMALDCRLSKIYDGFSHSILVGIVEEVRLAEGDGQMSLLWQGRRYHRTMEFVDLVHRQAGTMIVADDMLF